MCLDRKDKDKPDEDISEGSRRTIIRKGEDGLP